MRVLEPGPGDVIRFELVRHCARSHRIVQDRLHVVTVDGLGIPPNSGVLPRRRDCRRGQGLVGLVPPEHDWDQLPPDASNACGTEEAHPEGAPGAVHLLDEGRIHEDVPRRRRRRTGRGSDRSEGAGAPEKGQQDH